MTAKIGLAGTPRSIRVLFFGRKGCTATETALTHLNALKCKVTFVESSRRGESLPGETMDWTGEFIFCFRSLFVLPRALLERATIAAVNFHPGPTEHPGTGCINFALYQGDLDFGVTAHVMNEKVDNGPILECRRFPILLKDSVDSLLQRTHLELLDLFIEVVSDLVSGGAEALQEKLLKSSEIKWTGEARRLGDLNKLGIVELSVTKLELERVIRATHTQNYPTVTYIHGYEFRLYSGKTTP